MSLLAKSTITATVTHQRPPCSRSAPDPETQTTVFPQPGDTGSGILVIRRAEHDWADWAFHPRVVVFVEGGRVSRYFTAEAASGFGKPPPGTFDA